MWKQNNLEVHISLALNTFQQKTQELLVCIKFQFSGKSFEVEVRLHRLVEVNWLDYAFRKSVEIPDDAASLGMKCTLSQGQSLV